MVVNRILIMGFLDFGRGIVSLTRLCGGFCEFGCGFGGGD